MASWSGRTLGHHRVGQLIGVGGMGEVYEAEDLRLGRRVALKVLPTSVAGDRERLGRFTREARALAALSYMLLAPDWVKEWFASRRAVLGLDRTAVTSDRPHDSYEGG